MKAIVIVYPDAGIGLDEGVAIVAEVMRQNKPGFGVVTLEGRELYVYEQQNKASTTFRVGRILGA